jgi:integrase
LANSLVEGADGVRLHDLRHFVATQMMAAGVHARTGASRLGQANPNTFVNVYSHWLPAPDRAAAALLDDILDG